MFLVGALALAPLGCRQRADPLLAISGPRDLTHIEVRDAAGEVLWAIDSSEGRTLPAVYYGEIPTGFRQLVPVDGSAPRSLADGEPLIIETVSRDWQFVHLGHALGSTSFRASSSRMRPLD